MSSGAELYVYYRAAATDCEAALRVVREFQRRLRGEYPGLHARVLHRADETGDPVTLMEIYTFDDGRTRGVNDALRARISAGADALVPLLAGPRRMEVFEALD